MIIDFDFACTDDCLDRMAPSDLRVLVAERESLKLEVERLRAENEAMKSALVEIAKRGANPMTQYGYGTSKTWVRFADDVWELAKGAIPPNP